LLNDVALVLDDDVRIALAQAVDDLDLLEHLVLAAEDGEVLAHRGADSSRIFQGRSPWLRSSSSCSSRSASRWSERAP